MPADLNRRLSRKLVTGDDIDIKRSRGEVSHTVLEFLINTGDLTAARFPALNVDGMFLWIFECRMDSLTTSNTGSN